MFTTRPDTLFGVTYVCVAPEHPLVSQLATAEHRAAVDAYVKAAASKSDLERTELAKTKTGVFTGSYALHPISGKPVPIWVADYVLGSYGTGAVMAVPAHDERDWEFAKTFGLPVDKVVEGPGAELPFTGEGTACNSAAGGLDINGLGTQAAKAAVIGWLEQQGRGASRTNYKLRDWLFARQRYWGEPFPILIDEETGEVHPVPESDLPVLLPETDRIQPSGDGQSPLANIKEWVHITSPVTGRPVRRDTNTMPQWAGSCWYYLRYLDPSNRGYLIDPEVEKYWMNVDLYVGGAEHAVLHLLYARFWHKASGRSYRASAAPAAPKRPGQQERKSGTRPVLQVLYDLGVVSTKEPFQRLVSQGMILGEVEYTGYQSADGAWMSADKPGAEEQGVHVRLSAADVEKRGDWYVLKEQPEVKVSARAHKMSKSRGNVINPDDVVSQYGADSLRLYEMFMGPLRETKVWSTSGVEGVYRFLGRVWRLFQQVDAVPATKDQLRDLHACIKKVTVETEEMRFNTGISAMMEFVNAAQKWDNRPRECLEAFALLLSPYAPHMAEELWSRLGHSETLAYEGWPVWDEALLVRDTVQLAVQVNGKMRGTVEVAVAAGQDDAMAAAEEIIAKYSDGKAPKKVIFVPGKILNVVLGK